MRIALSTGNLHTAGSKYIIQDLARHLKEQLGWEVEIIVHLAGGNVFENLKKEGFVVHEIPLRFEHTSKLDFFKRVRKNAKSLRKLNFDVVHSFDYASSFAEALCARLAGIKFVFTKTNMLWNKNYGIKSRMANAIVSLNQDQTEKYFSAPAMQGKTELVPNGVDVHKFKPLKVAKHDIPTIGFVAYIVQVKGHPFFADVIASVKKKVDFPFQVLCAGSGEESYLAEVKDKIADLGIQEEFKLVGFVNDIPKFYNECHLAVLPTTERGEACPMAVLEALACGIPILVSNTPGNHNIVNDKVGWVKDFGEVELWADLLADVLSNLKETQSKGATAREFVEENYSLELFLDRHKSLYKKLTGKA